MGPRLVFKALLAIAAFIGAATCFAVPAGAQGGLIGQLVPTCFARVQPGDVPQAMFARPDRFDCHADQTRLGTGDFWVLSDLSRLRPRPSQPLVVRSTILWQDAVTVYGRYADGTLAADRVATHASGSRVQLGGILENHLPARLAPLTALLWRIDGSQNLRGILMGARIATPAESVRANLTMAAIYAAFGGLCVALLIYNFAMWVALRHRFQLLYCAMVVALLIYTFSLSGAVLWVWPDLAGATRLRMNYVSLGISAAAAVLFARAFFEDRLFHGWLNKGIYLVCGLLVTTGLLFAALAPWHIHLLNKLYSFAFLAMLAMVPVLLWRAFVERSNYLWIFSIAWAAPVAFAAIRVLNNLNYFRWNFWIDNSTILAMTSEALLSSLAIVYRVRLLSRERDDARVKELAAQTLADTDPLTGLLNRRAFLRQAIGRSGNQMLLVADIDHFKLVNETIGHDGGDEVLRLVARALRTAAPTGTLIARFGGEEFALLVPQPTALIGEDVLAKLRKERMPFDLKVTASIGAATGPTGSESEWKQLYRAADQALYDAKLAGRDCARDNPLPLAA